MFYNLINGHCYIGSSVKLVKRFRTQISNVTSKNNLPLHRAIIKYGAENFVYIILQYCEALDKDKECLGLEQHYLDLYQPE